MRPALLRWGWRLLDLAGYAVALTVVVAVLLAPLSLLADAGWNGVKFGLFLVGTGAFGYATLLLWPSRPGEDVDVPGDENRRTLPLGNSDEPQVELPGEEGARSETPFEAMLARVAPWSDVDPDDRLPPGAKLYAASLLMLAVSYAMEAVFGVRA